MNRTKYISTARSSTESSSGQISSISFKSTDYEHCLEIRYTVHYPFICDWLPEDSQNSFLCVMSLCEHQGNHVPCIVWATGQLCVLYYVSIRAVMFHVCVSIRAAVRCASCEHHGSHVLCTVWASGQPLCCALCEHQGSCVLFTVWASGKPCAVHYEYQGSCVPRTVWASE